ncbi:transposase [Streptomyces sp. NPDC002990]
MIPSLAASLAAVHDQRRALEAQISSLLGAHPLHPVLTSTPGIGVRTSAVLLVTVGDGTGFPSAAHLASYAGLAPRPDPRGPRSTANTHPTAETAAQTRDVPLCLRLHESPPRLPHLLRPPTRPRQDPHLIAPPPRPPTHQRPIRHAPRRHLLRVQNRHRHPRHMTTRIGWISGIHGLTASESCGYRVCRQDTAPTYS